VKTKGATARIESRKLNIRKLGMGPHQKRKGAEISLQEGRIKRGRKAGDYREGKEDKKPKVSMSR